MADAVKDPILRKAIILGDIKTARQTGKSKQVSRLIKKDKFDYKGTDAIKPPYNLFWLADYMVRCTEHEAAVNLKASTIISELQIIPVEGQETESKREGDESLEKEEKRIWERIDNLNPHTPTNEIFRRTAIDYEAIGCGYMEVLRFTTQELAQLNHASATDMRIRQDGIGFIQEVGDSYRYFKLFGDNDIPMSYASGKFPLTAEQIQKHFRESHNILIDSERAEELVAKEEEYFEEDEATEILDFQKYHTQSERYGLPDCLSCTVDMEILEKAKEYNYYFFQNHAMARWLILLSGPDDTLTHEDEEVIQNYITASIKGNSNVGKSLWLRLPSGVSIEIQRLDADIKEGSWEKLIYNSALSVARAEGVPLDLLQIVTPQGLGGTRTKQALVQFKEHVIDPGQKYFSNRINKNLVWSDKGLNINNWQIQFKSFDIDKTGEDVEYFTKMEKAGRFNTDEMRAFAKQLGFTFFDEVEVEGGKAILVDTNKQPLAYLAGTPEEQVEANKTPEEKTVKSLHDLKKSILEMVGKQTKPESEEELVDLEVELND